MTDMRWNCASGHCSHGFTPYIAPFIHAARRGQHYRRIKDSALVNPGARQSVALLGGDLHQMTAELLPLCPLQFLVT